MTVMDTETHTKNVFPSLVADDEGVGASVLLCDAVEDNLCVGLCVHDSDGLVSLHGLLSLHPADFRKRLSENWNIKLQTLLNFNCCVSQTLGIDKGKQVSFLGNLWS